MGRTRELGSVKGSRQGFLSVGDCHPKIETCTHKSANSGCPARDAVGLNQRLTQLIKKHGFSRFRVNII